MKLKGWRMMMDPAAGAGASAPPAAGAAPAPAATPPAPIFGQAAPAVPAAESAPAVPPTGLPDPSSLIGSLLSQDPGAAVSGQPPEDEVFKTPFMGRWTKRSEAEEAFRRAQNEDKRLNEELKAIRIATQREIANREAALAKMQKDLESARRTPAFRELSKEEFDKLAAENQPAAAEYLVNRRLAERDAQAARENEERQQQDRESARQALAEHINREADAMEADEARWPQFKAMQPLMDGWIERTRVNGRSPLAGHPMSPKILYFLTLGSAYYNALMKGMGAQADAARAAQASAAAAAAGARAPGAPAPGNPPAPADDDKAFGDALLAAAPKRLFGGGK